MFNFSSITRDELYNRFNRPESFELINVLDPKYYDLGMIKGSKKIPLNELENRLGELDKKKEVIVYCASSECDASKKAAEKLVSYGFKVKAYEGGIKDWKEGGLPMETVAQVAA